jgi:hypothetical protein
VYNTLVTLSHLYGCETWTFKQRRLKTAEMKFMRPTEGYNKLGRRRNEDILEELKVDQWKRN